MLFGELKPAALKDMKFQLPKDPPGNKEVLASGKAEAKLLLGCAQWGRTEWVGKIYSYGAKEKDFLKYYGQHYGSIELNATHYKIYSSGKIKDWTQKVENPNFKFCPKAHRAMSFLKHSPTRDSITEEFIKNVRAFGK